MSQASVGWFGEKSFSEPDMGKALNVELDREAYAVFCRPGGRPLFRKQPMRNVTYTTYPIPPIWGEPAYALMHVKVTGPNLDGDQLTWHGGEELLLPTKGVLNYEFYWPRSKSNDLLTATVHADPSSGHAGAIRILPHVPHRNGTAEGQTAEAWMVIRHLSGSMEAIEAHERKEDLELSASSTNEPGAKREKPGTVSLKQLRKDKTRAFMLLCDIPSRLRVARMRSGLSVTELANEVETHSQYIWRLERGATNVNTRTMKNIAEIVRLNLKDQQIPQYFEARPPLLNAVTDYQRFQPFCFGSATNLTQLADGIRWRPLFSRPEGYEHWMHPQIFEMKRDTTIALGCKPSSDHPVTLSTNLGAFGKQSWIVIEGELIFETPFDELGMKKTELLSPDSYPVLHFRNEAEGILRANRDCRLLRVEHSAEGCYQGLRRIVPAAGHNV